MSGVRQMLEAWRRDPTGGNAHHVDNLIIEIEDADRRKRAYYEEMNEAEGVLAEALGYSYDEEYGWNTGDHTVVSLAMEAREKIGELSGWVEELEEALKAYADSSNWYEDSIEGDNWVRKYGERGWEPAQRVLRGEQA